MRQPKWDKFETALLIEAYWKIKEDPHQRRAIVAELSTTLRARADFAIDDTFRNENGINMCVNQIEFLFSDGKSGLKNISDMFREMVKLYSDNRHEFEAILLPAKQMEQGEELSGPLGTKTSLSGNFDADFYQWLFAVEKMAIPSCRSYVSALHSAERFVQFHKLGPITLCSYELETVQGAVALLMQNEEFSQFNKLQHNRFSAAFQKLIGFLKYLRSDHVDTAEYVLPQDDFTESDDHCIDEASVLVEKFILEAKSGVSRADICGKFSNLKTHQINLALGACHSVVVSGRYYHRDNIYDYDEMAEILLEVITKLFSQNGGYTSAKLLYTAARPRLDDFFFYNNAFDSRPEVYDLAVHLFAQENYKGNTFIFANGMHIWQKEPNYPKDYHGLMIKYAREHGNSFSRDDALEYFEFIGSTSPSATFSNMIFTTGSRTFFQFAENRFVLAEALQINENFLTQLKTRIEALLEGEDYIAIGEIDDYFYMTLPTLPDSIIWSALLLEDILRVHDVGFTTIEAGQDNDKKTLPAALVRKNSTYKSFGDVVWSEVARTFSLPKEFTSSEFRDFLLNKGFIRGSEKMWSVHKTVAGDIRFYWTEQYGKVTIG